MPNAEDPARLLTAYLDREVWEQHSLKHLEVLPPGPVQVFFSVFKALESLESLCLGKRP